LVERSDNNDYSWSWWRDAPEALHEIDRLIERLQTGTALPHEIAALFAPTGPLQELSESSGWGELFLGLANRCDRALELAEPMIAMVFDCAACGRQAGDLVLRGRAARAELRRESFTGTLQSPVSGEVFELLHAALENAQAEAVFRLDPEYAPFYCPTCARSYCGDHWDRWDVFDEGTPNWHDSIRGRCPHGHERMLED
jgi:hypothetical protein